MLTVSFPLSTETMSSTATSFEYRKISAQNADCWNTFSHKNHKILSTRSLSILMMSSSECLLFVLFHKICFLVLQYKSFVSSVTVFENEGVLDGTCESAIQDKLCFDS